MDLWLVAAATGAGYIAKHLQQNLPSQDKDDHLDSFHSYSVSQVQPKFVNVFREIREQTCPLRRLADRRAGNLDDVLAKNFHEVIHHRLESGDGEVGGASTSNFYDRPDIRSLDSVGTTVVPESDHSREFWTSYHQNPDLGDGYLIRRFNRNVGNPRMIPHLYTIQPFDSLNPSESFLVGQFQKGRSWIDKDGALRSYDVPLESAVGPLLVTDGTRVIGRLSSDFQREMNGRDELIRPMRPDLPIRLIQNVDKGDSRRVSLSSAKASDSIRSQASSSGLLFFLGLMIGMMWNIDTSRTEVDELNEKLNQAKNLVRDLHEELEMKEQLTVKEINWKASSGGSSGRTITPHETYSYPNNQESKPDVDNSEAMREIEAELEAELERLELNMKITSLDNLPEFVEVDPDSEIDMVREGVDLKRLDSQHTGEISSSDHDMSSNELPPANYAVSPMELTLRLHEVIESRLRARVLELEAALESTQRRLSALSRNMAGDLNGELDGAWENSPNEDDHPFITNSNTVDPVVCNNAYENIDGWSDHGQSPDYKQTPMSSSNDQENLESR